MGVGGLLISGSAFFPGFSQNKIWVKKLYQTEVLKPIHIAPKMTALTRMTILNIHFSFLTKRDGADRIFPFAKQDINEWGSRYELKRN